MEGRDKKMKLNDDFGCKSIDEIEKMTDEIDWTATWSKKYPILDAYKNIKGIDTYSQSISKLYDEFKGEFGLNDTDTVLILKDMLYQKFKVEKKKLK